MPPIQQNLIGLLVGFFALAISIFRTDFFFTSRLRVYLLAALAVFALVLVFGFVARLLGKRFWQGLFFLFVIETILYTTMVVFPAFYGSILPVTGGGTRRALDEVHRSLKMLHNRTWGNTVQHTLGQFDAQVGYVLKPGAGVFGNHGFENRYEINSLGLRDSESALNNPEIVFLGDSFTMGWGVNQNEAFPQRVGALMAKKTLNAGISSFGTARELLLIDRLPLDSCRTLVVQYCENDAVENAFFVSNKNRMYSEPRQFENAQLRNDYGVYFFLKYTHTLFGEALKKIAEFFAPKPKQPSALGSEATFENTETSNFVDILSQIKARFGGQIVVVYVDAIGRPNKLLAFEQQAKRRGIEGVVFLDVLTPLNNLQHGLVYDDHLNAAGHQHIAAQIAGYLKTAERSGK